MEFLPKIIDFFKLPQKIILAIALASGIILFCKESILIQTGLLEFKNSYFKWIGLVFLISLSISIINLSLTIYNKLEQIIQGQSNKKIRIQRLNSLTEEEKALLQYYINNNTRSQILDISDGTVRELARLGIIYMAANISIGGTFFSHNIQPWAMDYLQEHSQLVITNYPEFRHAPWAW